MSSRDTRQNLTLFSTSLLSATATGVKILSAIAINKAIAVFIGPAGLALLSQFQSFVQVLRSLAEAGLSQGVVRYSAEYRDQPRKLSRVLSGVITINVVASALCAAMVLLVPHSFSKLVFGETDYVFAFYLLAATLPFFALSTISLSVLNGLGDLRSFFFINVTQAIYSMIATSVFIAIAGVAGALIAIATNQIIVFFLCMFRLSKNRLHFSGGIFQGIQPGVMDILWRYMLMSLVAAVVTPVTQFVIRTHVATSISWDAAGYLQAVWSISSVYLSVPAMALSTYYLPLLSRTKDRGTLLSQIRAAYLLLVPITLVCAALIYASRDVIVRFLFTPDFAPIADILAYQLIADVIRVVCFVLGYLLIAKAMTSVFIASEIIMGGLFAASSIALTQRYGIVGVTYAAIITYSAYFSYLLFFIRRYLRKCDGS